MVKKLTKIEYLHTGLIKTTVNRVIELYDEIKRFPLLLPEIVSGIDETFNGVKTLATIEL